MNQVEPMDTTPPLTNNYKTDFLLKSPSVQFISRDTRLEKNGVTTVYSVQESSLDAAVWEFERKCRITALACGDEHVLVLTDNGSLYSFGTSDYGQLGHTDRNACNLPKRLEFFDILAVENMVKDVTCGSWHSMALTAEGDLYSWGWNEFGQLGLDLPTGPDIFVTKPKMVKSLASKRVIQIKAGHSHSLVLTNSGEIYSFGSNSNGQLGLGIAKGLCLNKPRLIEMFTGFPAAHIEAGGFHSFALSISGSVFGFGKNSSGQLGVGKDGEGDKVQPTQLATLRSLGVRYISAGQEHSGFLTHDGGVFTCGNGEVGQLGHNSASNEVLPRKILEFGQPVYQVACGGYHTLCLTKDKLYSFGRLGKVFAGSHKNSPMHINALTLSVESIVAGGDKSFAVLGSAHITRNSLQNATNDLQSPIDYRQYSLSSQIVTITDDVISRICAAPEPVDQDIMTLTELVFSSPSVWNSSFLLKNNQHIPTTYKNMGVDLLEADTVLSKLEYIKSSDLKELIDQMIVKDLLPKLPHQLMHVEILRVYVLMPLLPHFQTGTNALLPVLFAERLQSLKERLSQVVLGWMYDSPVNQLQRLISIYKRTIIIIIESNQSQLSKDRSLRICLKLLQEFHSMNRNTNRLSYHTFAIPSLPSKVDIRDDYVKWIQYRGNKDRVLFFCDYPFVFDAQAKTLLLQTDQILQMNIAMNMAASQIIPTLLTFGPELAQQVQYLTLHINRSRLVPDTLEYLQNLTTADLKKPLRIKFIGEEAEDAGGVKKEFFLLLIREILNPQYGMFRIFEESRLIWFITDCFEDRIMYYLIGILCGLAIYNFIIVNLPFPLALYKKLLNEKIDLQDFKELNPTVARSLEQLMEYTGDDIEEVFALNFEISEDVFGSVKTFALKPGGSSIPVNQQNKAEFVELYIAHVFNTSVQLPFEAFKDGFERVCGGSVLPLFYAQELQAMVTGNEDYDWGELESNCTYKGGYTEDDPTIKLFWEVFHELSLEDKKQFLLFLTGSDRVPILGMKALKICLQATTDEKYLPSAHTCFNLLDLPRYQTKERLRYKLLQAIQHNEGFSLV